MTEQQLCEALDGTLHIHWTNLKFILISDDMMRLVPKSVVMISRILPVFSNQRTLYLALEAPNDRSITRETNNGKSFT